MSKDGKDEKAETQEESGGLDEEEQIELQLKSQDGVSFPVKKRHCCAFCSYQNYVEWRQNRDRDSSTKRQKQYIETCDKFYAISSRNPNEGN